MTFLSVFPVPRARDCYLFLPAFHPGIGQRKGLYPFGKALLFLFHRGQRYYDALPPHRKGCCPVQVIFYPANRYLQYR